MRALCLLLLAAAAAGGGPEAAAPADASETEAKAALQRFAEEYRAKAPDARRAAIEHLGAVAHPAVADRLLRTLRRLKDPAQIAAACRGLSRQKSSAAEAGSGVARLLVAEAEVEAKSITRNYGLPVDPKSGDLILDTPEARRAIAEAEARNAMRLDALRCLEALGYHDPADVEPLCTLLQSPHDGLVIGMFGTLGRWKAWAALPAILDLYRMYPSPSRWETGSVVDRSGTNATAKATWMTKFGHPNKQRPRPEVVQALVASLEAITGDRFKAPEDLEEYLKRPDVKAAMARSGRRRPVEIDPRKAIREAQKGLSGASFGDLEPEERDQLFANLARHDHPDTVEALARAIAKFGDHVDGILKEIERIREVLRPLESRTGLSDADAAKRESAEAELGTWAERERAARATFEGIIAAASRFEERATVERVLAVFPKHASWRVRWVLAEVAARWYAQPIEEDVVAKLFPALLALAKDPVPLVRVAGSRALGASRDPQAVATLKDLSAGDADWRVRAAAVLSLGDAGGTEAIGALVEAMATAEGRLLDDINATLLRITGWNLVYPEVWAQWWKDARGEVPPPPKEPPPVEGEVKQGHRFYGVSSRSKRVLYVVDISGSMTQRTKDPKDRSVGDGKLGRTRLDVAQSELKRAIGTLAPDATFSVVFFNHAVQVWDRELQKATTENRRAAITAVEEIRPSGATFTLGALREAFAVAGMLGPAAKNGSALVDTIFLLSDGAPTDSKLDDARLMDPAIILEAVRCWNRDRAIAIHTIAIDVVDSRFLRDLAAENGGKFVERK
jgi:HEAT repeat protein